MALGMIEVYGFATAIVVADAAAKAADVKVVALDRNKPANGDAARVPLVMAVKLEGTPAAVEAAMEAGIEEAKKRDLYITSHLIAAEIAGYLPYGEGWKYICEGRTAYDGDKPINTNGGRTSFGHAHAASGMADVYEACMQLRGECGERQIKNDHKTALLRGYGGAQNIAAVLLRTID